MRYRVSCPDCGEEPEDGRLVEASSAEEAVEAAAQRECSDDPGCYEVYIHGGQDLVVLCEETGEQTCWHVYGEPDIHFHASQKAGTR